MEQSEKTCFHEDIVSYVRQKMPAEAPIYEVAELFKVFGDSTRSRIICALSIEKLCVNDLAALLHMTQSAISHQLKILRDARLVRCNKQGREAYYTLDDAHIESIFALAFTHIMEQQEEL